MTYYKSRYPIGCTYCNEKDKCNFIKEEILRKCEKRNKNLIRFGYNKRC